MALALYEQHDAVGEIVLNAPPLNLLGQDLFAAMRDAMRRAHESDARAVLVRAEGDAFSAGADVKMFQGLDQEDARTFLAGVIDLIAGLERLTVPTLAVVQGLCFGGGLEVALACDLIWAAEDAQLGQLEAVIGGIPFAGGTQRLAARAGSARALEMVYTGGPYPAGRLQEWGIVNRTLPADQLLPKARSFAARLAAGPTVAHAASKDVVRAWRSEGVAAADAVTISAGARVMASDDLQEGVRSLLTAGPGNAVFHNR